MPRTFALGLLVLALALLVPTAVFAYTGGTASSSSVTDVTHVEGDNVEHQARPWIGLSLVPLNERLAEHLGLDHVEGIVVVRVHPESPAAEAGFERGDIVVTVGTESVDEVVDVVQAIRSATVGDTLGFAVLRGVDEIALSVVIGERPLLHRTRLGLHRSFHAQAKVWVGVVLAPLNENLAERLGLDATEGIVVLRVRPEGPAATGGIEQGDIILSVGDTAVVNISDIVQSIRQAEPGDTLTFTVARVGETDPVSIDITVSEGPQPHGEGLGIPYLNLVAPLAGRILEGEFIVNDREGNQVTLTVISGTISEVGADSLVIDSAAEGSDNLTVTVGEGTVIFKAGHKKALEDLAVDDAVILVLKDGELVAVLVKPLRLGRGSLGSFHGGQLPQLGSTDGQGSTQPRLFRQGGPQLRGDNRGGFRFNGPQLRGQFSFQGPGFQGNLPELFGNLEERFGDLQERFRRFQGEARGRLQDNAPRFRDRSEDSAPAPSQVQPAPAGSTNL